MGHYNHSITCCYKYGTKKLPNHWCTHYYHFRGTIASLWPAKNIHNFSSFNKHDKTQVFLQIAVPKKYYHMTRIFEPETKTNGPWSGLKKSPCPWRSEMDSLWLMFFWCCFLLFLLGQRANVNILRGLQDFMGKKNCSSKQSCSIDILLSRWTEFIMTSLTVTLFALASIT